MTPSKESVYASVIDPLNQAVKGLRDAGLTELAEKAKEIIRAVNQRPKA